MAPGASVDGGLQMGEEDQCHDVLVAAMASKFDTSRDSSLATAAEKALCDEQEHSSSSGKGGGGGVSYAGVGVSGSYSKQQAAADRKKFCASESAQMSKSDAESLSKRLLGPDAVAAWKACAIVKLEVTARPGLTIRADVEAPMVVVTSVWSPPAMGGSKIAPKVRSFTAMNATCSAKPKKDEVMNPDQRRIAICEIDDSSKPAVFLIDTTFDSETAKVPAQPTPEDPWVDQRQICNDGVAAACRKHADFVADKCPVGVPNPGTPTRVKNPVHQGILLTGRTCSEEIGCWRTVASRLDNYYKLAKENGAESQVMKDFRAQMRASAPACLQNAANISTNPGMLGVQGHTGSPSPLPAQ